MKHFRIKQVSFNNRKKQMTVCYAGGTSVTVHYGQLGITKSIEDAAVDTETRGRAVIITLRDGTREVLPYDQPLFVAHNPEFLLRNHLEILTARIRNELKKRGVSLRYLAEQLRTSDAQIQRLLNPTVSNKNLTQLYRVAALLELEVELRLKPAA